MFVMFVAFAMLFYMNFRLVLVKHPRVACVSAGSRISRASRTLCSTSSEDYKARYALYSPSWHLSWTDLVCCRWYSASVCTPQCMQDSGALAKAEPFFGPVIYVAYVTVVLYVGAL